MKNLFNFRKDISYFREFEKRLRERIKQASLLSLFLKVIFVIFKWTILLAIFLGIILVSSVIISEVHKTPTEKCIEECGCFEGAGGRAVCFSSQRQICFDICIE